jgi:glycosyltransferase involved in cell wall biosynthesis
MKLSIIVPVYNEQKTILQVVEELNKLQIDKEIIIVDDCSTDFTTDKLREKNIYYHQHQINKGKGEAIQTGLKYATGDYILIQDSDLEYNPDDIPKLVEKAKEGHSAVFGTRFHPGQKHKLSIYYIGNRVLTMATNILCRTGISDMETGYKLIETNLMRSLKLESKRFGFEPEVTAKLAKKTNIVEVPISYHPRTKAEGKKITWKDGVQALFLLFKYKLQRG